MHLSRTRHCCNLWQHPYSRSLLDTDMKSSQDTWCSNGSTHNMEMKLLNYQTGDEWGRLLNPTPNLLKFMIPILKNYSTPCPCRHLWDYEHGMKNPESRSYCHCFECTGVSPWAVLGIGIYTLSLCLWYERFSFIVGKAFLAWLVIEASFPSLEAIVLGLTWDLKNFFAFPVTPVAWFASFDSFCRHALFFWQRQEQEKIKYVICSGRQKYLVNSWTLRSTQMNSQIESIHLASPEFCHTMVPSWPPVITSIDLKPFTDAWWVAAVALTFGTCKQRFWFLTSIYTWPSVSPFIVLPFSSLIECPSSIAVKFMNILL